MPFNLLAITHLNHAFANHCQPLANSDKIAFIRALRPSKWNRSKLNKIEVIDVSKRPMVISQVLILLKAIFITKRMKFDAIVTFTPLPYGLLGLIISITSKTPFHVGIIGEKLFHQLQTWKKYIVWSVLQKCDTISVPGDRIKKKLIRLGITSSKIFILPHGVTPDFQPCKDGEKKYDAIFVGDLLPVKQVNLIIKVWEEVVKKRKNAKLCIIGDGSERNNLEKKVEDYKLSQNVIFTGFTNEVARYLRQSKLFILASKSEGLPFSIIEAMACGVIPVVNNVGEISNLLSHQYNGLCMKAEVDIAEYSENIVALLNNPIKMKILADRAVNSVKHLTYTRATEAWNRILNRLIY